jgi:hypothetical protein
MHEYKLLYQFAIMLFTLQNKVHNLTDHRFVVCLVDYWGPQQHSG